MKHAIVKSHPNWATLIKRWAGSGLSQKEFCRREGIYYRNFLKARRCYTDEVSIKDSKADSLTDFIPVSIEPPQAAPEIEVELPMGVVIRFRGVQPS